MIDIQEKKNKILEFLKKHGPSLPVHVAKTIQMDPVFASAILSELLSSRLIKISHMKVGASPLYLLSGQEEMLEGETENLKSVEREAQEKLKDKKVLVDNDEEPATRVALRNLKDFAVPFKFKDAIMWKYAFIPQDEVDEILYPKEKVVSVEEDESSEKPQVESREEGRDDESSDEVVPKAWEVKKDEIKQAKEKSKSSENIFDDVKKKSAPKTFIEEVKRFLEERDISIVSLEEIDKRKVTAIVESNGERFAFFAFNKARVDDAEILKCYRVADKKAMRYQILIRGGLTKKMTETISAHQSLLKVNKLGR